MKKLYILNKNGVNMSTTGCSGCVTRKEEEKSKLYYLIKHCINYLKYGGKIHAKDIDYRYYGKCKHCGNWISTLDLLVIDCNSCGNPVNVLVKRKKFYRTFNVFSWFSKPLVIVQAIDFKENVDRSALQNKYITGCVSTQSVPIEIYK
jgi:hypothetical protein